MNAERKRSRKQKTSRVGRLDNDDGEVIVISQKGDGEWSDKVGKLMDTFLRAQVSKQQEIDCFRQQIQQTQEETALFSLKSGRIKCVRR